MPYSYRQPFTGKHYRGLFRRSAMSFGSLRKRRTFGYAVRIRRLGGRLRQSSRFMIGLRRMRARARLRIRRR